MALVDDDLTFFIKVMLQVSHESKAKLERLRNLSIQVWHKVEDPFRVGVYSEHCNAIWGADQRQRVDAQISDNMALKPQKVMPLYISTMSGSGNTVISMKNPPVKVRARML